MGFTCVFFGPVLPEERKRVAEGVGEGGNRGEGRKGGKEGGRVLVSNTID